MTRWPLFFLLLGTLPTTLTFDFFDILPNALFGILKIRRRRGCFCQPRDARCDQPTVWGGGRRHLRTVRARLQSNPKANNCQNYYKLTGVYRHFRGFELAG